jgi:NAD(P)-dependent dehydrogenase (short-subunit alcohol dehydrogenase family)
MEKNMSDLPFKDHICVVTGASKNIGTQIALSLAQQGANIVLQYHQDRKGAETVAESIQKSGQQSIIVQADLRDRNQAKSLIDKSIEIFGQIDLLVNNMGVFLIKPLRETTIDDWHNMIDSNLHSAYYCSTYALEHMREKQSGHIVFIGSGKADSTRARQNACPYGIAKTGVVLLAKTIAREEGQNGIRANVINPGAIEGGWATDERRNELIQQVPMHKLGTASDIANAVLYLHSQQGAYCNGSVINVDGGLWL